MRTTWQKTAITTDRGERVEAVAPFIVSASRSTDIPAFYGEWFLRRLKAGYTRWVNPFSGRPEYVSFENARLFVFWSKNPGPFMPVLAELDNRNLSYYFHVTVNDYGKEGLENGVPPLTERLLAFTRLSGLIGKERVLWRFDPLLLTDTLDPVELLQRIGRIGGSLAGHTERLTLSFITLYEKTARNLRNAGIRVRPWDKKSREMFLRRIGDWAEQWKMQAVMCADKNDYLRFGIAKGHCIDAALIARLFPGDRVLGAFLDRSGGAKDRGQRPFCGCVASKDIGAYNTCGHRCMYCYANASPERAVLARERHSAESETIG